MYVCILFTLILRDKFFIRYFTHISKIHSLFSNSIRTNNLVFLPILFKKTNNFRILNTFFILYLSHILICISRILVVIFFYETLYIIL
ncbi:hypothetical protein C1645_795041 [Glomus cerebriforme]|uniref:Uncharacterized protein n=1 Tax=Glomus cerebriforme TaxID=658196 RepID=A0A397S2G4_9GLOM|nr:hypothetical protein C1645_795041 [Glomus cerebriforme]